MALLNCEECGTLVSDQATSCPKCGHPFYASKTNKAARILGIFIAIGFAIFLIKGCCTLMVL